MSNIESFLEMKRSSSSTIWFAGVFVFDKCKGVSCVYQGDPEILQFLYFKKRRQTFSLCLSLGVVLSLLSLLNLLLLFVCCCIK